MKPDCINRETTEAAARARCRLGWLADSLLLVILTAALIWPLFQLKYLDNWGSIESTFISDGRFLKDHWPHPLWQPNWYCGTRFDYIYPPALRYGTAAISRFGGVIPAKAYHIYTGFFYCIGILGVYVLVRIGSGWRRGAWLAAAGAALLSPAWIFLSHMRAEAFDNHMIPQRLNVLMRYGEGPHMSAFALLPFALAFAFPGLKRGRPAALALSAVFAALVVSNNFYGATALAILFPVLVWALWVTTGDHRIWLRAAAIGVLAYGLTAFWLVPSYLRITLRNMKLVSEPGNAWSGAVALAAVALFVVLSMRFARGRPERAYPLFVTGAVLFVALNVLGSHFVGFRVIGEPERLVPELDLLLILFGVECFRQLWKLAGAGAFRLKPRTARAALAVLVALVFAPGAIYVGNAWKPFPRDWEPQQRVEYKLTSWIANNLPGARMVATGSLRFWYNAWHDLPQLGGGSEQGLLNESVTPAQWQLTLGEEPQLGILWMQAMGTDGVTVHDKHSRELYHDFVRPRKFHGVLPLLYDDGEGNAIYQAPRRFPDRARVVNREQVERLKPVAFDTDLENLTAYVNAVENGPDSRAQLQRDSTDSMRIRTRIEPGQMLLVQESFDPAWRAYSGGRPLPVRSDVLGLMLVEAPPGEHEIRLVFELPRENAIGRIATLLTIPIVGVLLLAGLRKKEKPI